MTPMCSFYCKLRCHLHITQRFQWLHAEWETYPAHPSYLIGSAGSSGPIEGPEPLVCLKVTGAPCSIPSGSSAILGWNSRHRGGPRLVLYRVLDEFAFWKWEQNSFSQQCKFIRFEALDLRKKQEIWHFHPSPLVKPSKKFTEHWSLNELVAHVE